jgi:GWxTD domain-containing protein
LVLEFLDVDETVLHKRECTFDRFNPTFEDVVVDFSQTVIDPRFFEELPKDSLFYYLESLTPISSRADVAQIFTLIDKKDIELAQKYFQAYWIRTNPEGPTDAWIKYKKSVLAVQKEYGTLLMPGYKSDRGRVFLQYGPPNAKIQRPNEPGEYPYEIWQYYKIASFSNRRFVFYNPMGVGNEYVLLHSDLPGELFNNRWLQDVSRTGGFNRSRVNDEGILDGGRR